MSPITPKTYLNVDPLSGPRLKIERAEHHANALVSAVERFQKGKKKGSRPQYNVAIGAIEFATLDNWDLPLYWSTIIGDVIGNARAGLDHLYWLIEGRPNPKQRRVYFPIFDRPVTIPFVKAKPNMRKLIEDVQPHKRLGKKDPLWILHELNNADKHRLLVIAVNNVGGASFSGTGPLMMKMQQQRRFEWVFGRLYRDAAFLRLRAPVDEKVDMNPQAVGIPVFDQGPAEGHEVLMVLADILQDIRQNILSQVTLADLP